MAKFPSIAVGTKVTADLLNNMLPDVYIKQANEDINTDATLTADAELSGIPLAVGTHWIRVMLLFTTPTSTAPDIKTQWGFLVGTWTNPTRTTVGPGIANTAAGTAVTPLRQTGQNANSDATYGSGASTAFHVIYEECFGVSVSVAGNFEVRWAQNASDASTLSVKAGSSVVVVRLS